MRALTVQQPWATAIMRWGKEVENRTRNLAGSYRGPVAIHAGLREDLAAYDDDLIREVLGQYDDGWILAEQLVTGAIIGVVDLASVHDDSDHGRQHSCSPWAQPNLWHLILERPRALADPVPCRGRLGLWTPAAELVDRIRAQL